ncbi:MAG: metal-binding protein [Methylococcaceae bacterium]|nr:metal-binding protein [Methylococcaceae bacterium]
MREEKKSCALCGLAVEVSGFHLTTQQGEQHFCCEGCKGIYQLLREEELLRDKPDNDDR